MPLRSMMPWIVPQNSSFAVGIAARGQPSRLGQKAGLLANLMHQPHAAVAISQAGKYIGVDFGAEAEIFRFGMGFQKRIVPGDEAIALGQTAEEMRRPVRSISIRKRLK